MSTEYITLEDWQKRYGGFAGTYYNWQKRFGFPKPVAWESGCISTCASSRVRGAIADRFGAIEDQRVKAAAEKQKPPGRKTRRLSN